MQWARTRGDLPAALALAEQAPGNGYVDALMHLELARALLENAETTRPGALGVNGGPLEIETVTYGGWK